MGRSALESFPQEELLLALASPRSSRVPRVGVTDIKVSVTQK